MQWYLQALNKYAVFAGRARRSEYWMFALFNIIFCIAAMVLDIIIGTYFIIYSLYLLAIIIPSLAVTVRRLHDIGKSGAWFFIAFIPFIGFIWLLILMCTDSGMENIYGKSPKYQTMQEPIIIPSDSINL
jgi:uncharacterized membrane protein YhaH (DUF805 family)